MTETHLTATTRFMEIDGDRFAYRRWGNSTAGQPPLFFLQHFRGGMDHWDPLMTDGLAAGREVILTTVAALRRLPASHAPALKTWPTTRPRQYGHLAFAPSTSWASRSAAIRHRT